MNWQEVTQNVMMFLGGSSIIGFVGLELFKMYLNKNVDKYRHQLGKETEIFKQQLKLITQEHQIKYFKLHNDRANIIKKLYRKLNTMETGMRNYMAKYKPDESNNEQLQKLASESTINFLTFFHQNEIFFEPSICLLIKEIDDLCSGAWYNYTFYDTKEAKDYAKDDIPFRKERFKALKSSWETIDKKIPPVKEKLANQFRNLLGVIDSNGLCNKSLIQQPNTVKVS